MKIHNTLTRRVEILEPLQPGKVGMYTCGPTVYDFAHIGNFRAYVWEDLLRRTPAAFGLRGHAGDEHHRHRGQDHPQHDRERTDA